VVRQGDLGGELEQRRRAAGEDLVPHGGVVLHDLELVDRERPVFSSTASGTATLPMSWRRAASRSRSHHSGVFAERVGDLGGQIADPLGVLAGVGVAELGEDRQPLERLELGPRVCRRRDADHRLELVVRSRKISARWRAVAVSWATCSVRSRRSVAWVNICRYWASWRSRGRAPPRTDRCA
jgi:hypothetical protein